MVNSAGLSNRPQHHHVSLATATLQCVEIEFLYAVVFLLFSVKDFFEVALLKTEWTLDRPNTKFVSFNARTLSELPPAIHLGAALQSLNEESSGAVRRRLVHQRGA